MHCMKNIRLWSFSAPFSVQRRENMDQKNSEYGHFSCGEDQGEKQIKALEEHAKQLVKSSSEKESLTFLKQKEIFEELANERMGEIQNLSKQINFNNLIYHFKGESDPKNFIGFKGPLAFYKKALKKAEKKEKIKRDIDDIPKGRYKSEDQKSAIENIKTLYESQEVIRLLNDYSKIASKAKYR